MTDKYTEQQLKEIAMAMKKHASSVAGFDIKRVDWTSVIAELTTPDSWESDANKETFSIEEIEASIAKARNGKLCIPEKIIAELQRPKQQFKEGEVIFKSLFQHDVPIDEFIRYDKTVDAYGYRSLNRTECPWGGVAIDALEKLQSTDWLDHDDLKGWKDQQNEHCRIASEALTQIKAMIGEE